MKKQYALGLLILVLLAIPAWYWTHRAELLDFIPQEATFIIEAKSMPLLEGTKFEQAYNPDAQFVLALFGDDFVRIYQNLNTEELATAKEQSPEGIAQGDMFLSSSNAEMQKAMTSGDFQSIKTDPLYQEATANFRDDYVASLVALNKGENSVFGAFPAQYVGLEALEDGSVRGQAKLDIELPNNTGQFNIFQIIPNDNTLFVEAFNLADYLQTLRTHLNKNKPEFATLMEENIAHFELAMGLSLEDDIFSLLQSNFVICLEENPDSQASYSLIFDVSEHRAEAKELFQKLDSIAYMWITMNSEAKEQIEQQNLSEELYRYQFDNGLSVAFGMLNENLAVISSKPDVDVWANSQNPIKLKGDMQNGNFLLFVQDMHLKSDLKEKMFELEGNFNF